MSNFYTDVIRKDHRFNSTDVIKDMALLEPVTRAAVAAIIADGAGAFQVLETYRSQARQHYLFGKGATRLSKVGCHGYGVACDIGLIHNGKMDPDGAHYDLLRILAEKHGLISGSDWGQPNVSHSFRDYDHVQRIAISRQNSMFAGTWYPDANYNPLVDLGRTPK